MSNAIEVVDWDTIPNLAQFKTILIGNGFSIGLQSTFKYDSLMEKADFDKHITQIFSDLNTVDFEIALESLNRADYVIKALGKDEPEIRETYQTIRSRLFETVRSLHPLYQDIGYETFIRIRRCLADYNTIYTTNYDVLLYWSILSQQHPYRYFDYFYKRPYNTFEFEAGYRMAQRSMYYLHGAVHLWHDPMTGSIGKHVANGNQLLEVIEQQPPDWPNAEPLFVSEGDAERKREAIKRSVYLRVALEELTSCSESIVVFGFGFGDSDRHILNAVAQKARYGHRRVAVSQHMINDGYENDANRVRLRGKLEDQGNQVIFFDSSTHPLGRIISSVLLLRRYPFEGQGRISAGESLASSDVAARRAPSCQGQLGGVFVRGGFRLLTEAPVRVLAAATL